MIGARRLAAACAVFAAVASAQEAPPINVSQLPTSLAGEWLFRIGHDPSWASPFRERRNWQRIRVPGSWESQGFAAYNGHAWYRLPLFVSSQLAGQNLGLDAGLIADVDEVFLNGRKVGATGTFPPRFARASSSGGCVRSSASHSWNSSTVKLGCTPGTCSNDST